MSRMTTVPGIGPITAAAIKARVPDMAGFTSTRHFAAWMGLTPKPHSSGDRERLGSISKMGNITLRTLPIVGATSVLQRLRRQLSALLDFLPSSGSWDQGSDSQHDRCLASEPNDVLHCGYPNVCIKV